MKIKYITKALKIEPIKVKTLGKKSPSSEKVSKVKVKPNRFKESIKKIGKKSFSLVKSRKFLTILGLIVLVGSSFFAGVKVGPYITPKGRSNGLSQNNPISNRQRTTNSEDSTSTSSNVSKNVVFNGSITSISPTQIEVLDKKGDTKKFDFTPKTITVSKDGKAIKNTDLKVGYTVIIYAIQGENDSLSLSRLKILETN